MKPSIWKVVLRDDEEGDEYVHYITAREALDAVNFYRNEHPLLRIVNVLEIDKVDITREVLDKLR